jgi:hypothetical protein
MKEIRYRHSKRRRNRAPVKLLSTLFAVVVISVAAVSQSATSPNGLLAGISGYSDCRIKGNISHNTGEQIYHVPGQEHYDVTRISPQHGERWFCTEQEARQAGWRKAHR